MEEAPASTSTPKRSKPKAAGGKKKAGKGTARKKAAPGGRTEEGAGGTSGIDNEAMDPAFDITELDVEEVTAKKKKQGGEWKSGKSFNDSRNQVVSSEPNNVVFVQKGKRFQSKSKETITEERIARALEEEEVSEEEGEDSDSRTMAKRSISCIRVSSLFCHGLLAGLLLLYCIICWTLPNDFHLLTRFANIIIHFLLCICLISVLNRYDLASPTASCCQKFIKCQSGAFVIIIYFLAYFFHLAATVHEDQIFTISNNGTYLEAGAHTTYYNGLYGRTWKAMTTLEAIGAILGFLFLSISSSANRLVKNLDKGHEEIFRRGNGTTYALN